MFVSFMPSGTTLWNQVVIESMLMAMTGSVSATATTSSVFSR